MTDTTTGQESAMKKVEDPAEKKATAEDYSDVVDAPDPDEDDLDDLDGRFAPTPPTSQPMVAWDYD
jgi:hypothetical protein